MRIQVVEDEDSVTINGVVFQRPFVEKPVSGEDHNIYGQFGASVQCVAVCVMVSLVQFIIQRMPEEASKSCSERLVTNRPSTSRWHLELAACSHATGLHSYCRSMRRL